MEDETSAGIGLSTVHLLPEKLPGLSAMGQRWRGFRGQCCRSCWMMIMGRMGREVTQQQSVEQ